jgi:hypothetical protein
MAGLAICIALAPAGAGQRLAQRNWAGSGMAPAESWWSRAIFCQVELQGIQAGLHGQQTGLKGVTAQLDALESPGCDAIELKVSAESAGASTPIDARYGTLDDANDLIDGLGKRKLRLVLALPVGSLNGMDSTTEATLEAEMRFWLSRGVAGFVLQGNGETATPAGRTIEHRLRTVTATALGSRALIGDGVDAAELQLSVRRVAGADAAGFRAAIAGLGISNQSASPLLAAVGLGRSKALAAMLLAQGDAAMIPWSPATSRQAAPANTDTGGFSSEDLLLWVPKRAGEEGEALDRWYQSLEELHHSNPVLRGGVPKFLDHDSENVVVWVMRGKDGSAPVLVACNLSGKPVRFSATVETRAMGIRGTYLRTLLRSWDGGPALTLGDIEMPAGEVFLGEIR